MDQHKKPHGFIFFSSKTSIYLMYDPPYPGPMHPWDTGAWLWRTVAAILQVWLALINQLDALGELRCERTGAGAVSGR